MKVIHVNLARTWRGGERQVFLLMEGLQKEKIEQVLICRKGSALEKEVAQKGYRFYSLSNKPFSILHQARIFRKFEKEGFDIIHCHESKGHTLGIIGKVFWKTNQKLILHRRVIFPIKRKITTDFKYSEKHISKIICISKAVEKSVKNSIGFKRTVVVPSMISLNPPLEKSGEFKKEWKINEKLVIGYIAALTEEKDHYTFLNTAKFILNSQFFDVHFVIIGEGYLKENLIDYTNQIGIGNKVTFTGFIKDIPGIIQEIDALLFTSIAEGLGTTILDFFAAKRPVVATKSGGAEELVTDGITGFLCNAGDIETLAEKVSFLLKNTKKTEEIVNNASKFVEAFSIASVTSKTIEVYRSV